MQVSVAPGVWQSISQEDAKAMDEATEMDFSCGAGISLPFSLQLN